MSTIKLHYFDARGLAEVSRLVLALADKKFEDIRYSHEEWQNHKSEAPFGQAPFLDYDGVKIAQSSAMACFLARENGLFGKSNLDAAVIEQVISIFKDYHAAWMKVFFESDQEKMEELQKKVLAEDAPKFLGFLTKLLKQNTGSPFFVGNEITLADLYLYELVFSHRKRFSYDFSAYPELETLYEKVGDNARIKAYVEQRKDTEF